MTKRTTFPLNSSVVVIIAFLLIGVSSDQTSRLESRSIETETSPHSENFGPESLCRGEWKSPQNCNTYNCDYKANWEYIDDSDDIVFTVSTKNRNKWTGIGFSENQAMPDTDAVLGLVEESGRFFLMDSWLRAYEAPPLDPSQNLHNMSAWRENGITTLRFARKRITGDNRDFQFSDTNCPYLIFPVMGGVFNAVNKRIRKHEITPIISDRRVCIRSCKPSTAPTVPVNTGAKQDSDHTIKNFDESDTKELSTAQTPHITTKTQEIEEISDNLYKIEMKFPGIWRQSFEQKNSNEYKNMISNIREQMQNELNKNYPTFTKINVNELIVVSPQSNSVIASMDLAIKPMDDQTQEIEASILSSALNAMISDQFLGELRVDPKYLIVARKEDDENGKNTTEKSDNFFNYFGDDGTKWMIIFVGIAALIGLVLIQAFCMLCRNDNKQNDNKQKNDKQSPNSQWKDYAAVTARSGYTYDNYGVTDETDTPMKSNGQSLGRGEKVNSNKHLYKNTGEKMPQKYISATLERQPSRSHRSHEFTSAYATHDRNAPFNRNSYAQPSYLPQLQPDFYFMPHQRRYSGEVVRVFVDYNSPQFTPK